MRLLTQAAAFLRGHPSSTGNLSSECISNETADGQPSLSALQKSGPAFRVQIVHRFRTFRVTRKFASAAAATTTVRALITTLTFLLGHLNVDSNFVPELASDTPFERKSRAPRTFRPIRPLAAALCAVFDGNSAFSSLRQPAISLKLFAGSATQQHRSSALDLRRIRLFLARLFMPLIAARPKRA